MTDPSIPADVAETANFLRRFADLMSNGHNAKYLLQAAVLLETLTTRLAAATDEEQLWRYRYETVTEHADALETECDALKQDIEGHLDITNSILADRDALKAELGLREAELSERSGALSRERDEFAAKVLAHEATMTELRGGFDEERERLKTTIETQGRELGELCRSLEGERNELQSQLKTQADEFAVFRADSERELAVLKAQVEALEIKRAELRSTFDRISDLRVIEPAGQGAPVMPSFASLANPPASPGIDQVSAIEDAHAVVPKATLHRARAQFEFLGKECIRRGDIASQVMCELGAQAMDMALVTAGKSDYVSVGEVALRILEPPGRTSTAIADTM